MLSLAAEPGNKIRAQDADMLQLFSRVGQSSLLNPAVQNYSEKLVIGIPVVSGVYVGWYSNFAPNSIFSDDFSTYSFNRFYDSLTETGKARLSGGVSIFYASLKQHDWNYSFTIHDKYFGTTKFNREIIKLINDGTLPYLGTEKNFGSGSFHFDYYRELAVGISRRVWKQLDFGIRPKLLFGKYNFDADNINFAVETNDQQQLILTPTGSFSITGPLKYSSKPEIDFNSFSADIVPGDYFFSFRNMGLAADIGFVYRPNRLWEISGSVLDLGFIGFKYKTFNVEFNEPIIYEEYELFQSNDPENTEMRYTEPKEALKAFGDSVSYNTNIAEAVFRNFEAIPIKLNVKAEYKHSQHLSLGIINQFSEYGEHSINKLSGYANTKIKNRFEFVGNLTLYNFAKIMVGAGGCYTADNFQFYIASGNIIGILQPTGANNINLCFGLNLFFTTKN